MTDQTSATPPADENSLIAERRAKLTALRGQGIAFPNDFRRSDYAGDLQAQYGDTVSVQTFSGESKAGVDELRSVVAGWLGIGRPAA